MSEITTMAARILHMTNDGDELHATDLAMLQCAVNLHLTEEGIEKFRELYKLVDEGDYDATKRWT